MVATIARLAALAVLAILGVMLATLLPGAAGVRACGENGPFDFDTYEAEPYTVTYSRAIELATAGKAVSASHSVAGQTINVLYQGLLKGPRASRTTASSTALTIPPTIYKSIVWAESNWGNGSLSIPYGGVGPVLRSFDCGYGLGQVTTGMTNNGGPPTARQALIGTHFLYNVAEGVRILADKWNSAPRFRPIAGEGDPEALEDWYYAIWSYNGFAFVNHPLNPNRDPLRPAVFPCGDGSAPGASAYAGRFNFTYPELVYGCMRYPPKVKGQPLWQAQDFDMPHMEVEAVAQAFLPGRFLGCEDDGFSGGCPLMDYPTAFTIPAPDEPATQSAGAAAEETVVVTHKDSTPPINPALAAGILGAPRLSFEGPDAVSLTSSSPVSIQPVFVYNNGTWLGPYRVRVSAPWIGVRHAVDPSTRTIDGGVSIGAEVPIVIKSDPRVIAGNGYVSSLLIFLVSDYLLGGTSKGSVTFESLLGVQASFTVEVTAINTGVAAPLPRRAIIVAVASDEP